MVLRQFCRKFYAAWISTTTHFDRKWTCASKCFPNESTTKEDIISRKREEYKQKDQEG